MKPAPKGQRVSPFTGPNMTEQQFVYWLQGFAELTEQPPSAEQWKSIREHLAMVFKKVTPPVNLSVKVPDLKDSQAIKDMLEKARQHRVAEAARIPYQPHFLEQGVRPGEIIC
jgi:hypothetical protein